MHRARVGHGRDAAYGWRIESMENTFNQYLENVLLIIFGKYLLMPLILA